MKDEGGNQKGGLETLPHSSWTVQLRRNEDLLLFGGIGLWHVALTFCFSALLFFSWIHNVLNQCLFFRDILPKTERLRCGRKETFSRFFTDNPVY